jgi:hypothetical protein
MEQTTPFTHAGISGKFEVKSASTKVGLNTLSAQIAATTITQGSVTRDVKESQDEIKAYTLNTTSAQFSAADTHGHSAGASHTVTAAQLKATGSDGVLVAGATVSVAGGMIVFKGSSVMVNGSV